MRHGNLNENAISDAKHFSRCRASAYADNGSVWKQGRLPKLLPALGLLLSALRQTLLKIGREPDVAPSVLNALKHLEGHHPLAQVSYPGA